MHQTFRLTLTNNNFWVLSYWEGNLSYGNRQQIQNYLSNMGNLLSFHLKDCIFIAIFLQLIDFLCNFLLRQSAVRFSTQMDTVINACLSGWCSLWEQFWVALCRTGMCSLLTALGGDVGAAGHDVSPPMLITGKAMTVLVLPAGLGKRCVDRQTVNVSFFKKEKKKPIQLDPTRKQHLTFCLFQITFHWISWEQVGEENGGKCKVIVLIKGR